MALFRELQRQARLGVRFESQVQSAALRTAELEALVEQLQRENQRLLAMGEMQRRSSSFAGAGGRLPRPPAPSSSAAAGEASSVPGGAGAKGLAPSTAPQPSAGGARPPPTATAPAPMLAATGFVYGGDAGLAMSALEQQLELAEREVGDVGQIVARLSEENARLAQAAAEAR